jgi:Anti-sigma-K factor rskA
LVLTINEFVPNLIPILKVYPIFAFTFSKKTNVGKNATNILILLLTGFSLYKTYTLRQINNENAALVTKNEALVAAQQHLRDQIAMLKDSDTQRVILSDGSAKVNTYLYYNPLREEIALDLGGIAVPPEGKYLQLWGLEKNKKVRLGMIQSSAVGSWQTLPYKPALDSFMVSLDVAKEGDTFPTIVLLNGVIKK